MLCSVFVFLLKKKNKTIIVNMFKMPHKFNKDVTKSELNKTKAFIVKSFLTDSYKRLSTLTVEVIVQVDQTSSFECRFPTVIEDLDMSANFNIRISRPKNH